MSELVERLRKMAASHWAFTYEHDDVLREAAARIEELEAALEAIESQCTEEIRARFPGGEHKAQGSVVYALLCLPRNVARKALERHP